MMTDYKQVYKNTGLTPRTYDQAFKTADYATALWKCETPNEKAVRLLFSWVVASLMIAFIFSSLYALFFMFAG